MANANLPFWLQMVNDAVIGVVAVITYRAMTALSTWRRRRKATRG